MGGRDGMGDGICASRRKKEEELRRRGCYRNKEGEGVLTE